MIDSFKVFDKRTYAVISNYPAGQNALSILSRQDGGSGNYMFSTSKDGRSWTVNEYRAFVTNGGSSKPAFDKFFGIYYLGWQKKTRIGGVSRSVFNIDISVDGVNWERKYRFESANSFKPERTNYVRQTGVIGHVLPLKRSI